MTHRFGDLPQFAWGKTWSGSAPTALGTATTPTVATDAVAGKTTLGGLKRHLKVMRNGKGLLKKKTRDPFDFLRDYL